MMGVLRPMVQRVVCVVACCVGLLTVTQKAAAQPQNQNPHTQTIDQIRLLQTVGANDQGRIAEWVRFEVERLAQVAQVVPNGCGAAARAFRTAFRDQFTDPQNTQAFLAQFPVQTSVVAQTQFADANVDPWVAGSLARALVDMKRSETYGGLLKGMACHVSLARHLCARGLANQRAYVASDNARLATTVKAIEDAATAESSPVVLGSLYRALAYPNQLAAVFDAYVAIFDQRIAARRKSPAADGAEASAFAFFRDPVVTNSMTAGQKTQLVAKLAGFLRLDAERYNTAILAVDEIDRLERSLVTIEEILATVAGGESGDIRGVLAAGGFANRALVVREAYEWVGDPNSKIAGTLNASPWNVPVGVW